MNGIRMLGTKWTIALCDVVAVALYFTWIGR